jgi:hypothetical protein
MLISSLEFHVPFYINLWDSLSLSILLMVVAHHFFAVSEDLLHVSQLQDPPPKLVETHMQQASQVHWYFSRKSKFGVALVSVI